MKTPEDKLQQFPDQQPKPDEEQTDATPVQVLVSIYRNAQVDLSSIGVRLQVGVSSGNKESRGESGETLVRCQVENCFSPSSVSDSMAMLKFGFRLKTSQKLRYYPI